MSEPISYVLTARIRRQPPVLAGGHYYLEPGTVVWLVTERTRTLRVSTARDPKWRDPERDTFTVRETEVVRTTIVDALVDALDELLDGGSHDHARQTLKLATYPKEPEPITTSDALHTLADVPSDAMRRGSSIPA